MGNTWEVWAWIAPPGSKEHTYVSVYRGDSFFAAMWSAIKIKRGDAGCVKVEWR